MFLFRKNIILVPADYDGVSNTKGLLSFDAYTGKTICNLHCYNIDIDKELLLGVAVQNHLYKIKVMPKEANNVNFDLDTEIKNNQNISVVLLNVDKNNYDIILWGSTELNNNWQTALKNMIEDENIVQPKQENFENKNAIQNQLPEQNKIQSFDSDEQIEQNTTIDEKICENDTKIDKFEQNIDQKPDFVDDVMLDEYIDKVIELSESDEQNNENTELKNQESANDNIDADKTYMPSFYKKISPQIDKLFGENQNETILSEIIPNSKFCKVEFDDGTGYYVFGIIYQNGLPQYLCYGLPAKKDSKPPVELADYYQWLPIDPQNEQGDGFYLMYQDAETGQNISVEII